MTSTMDVRHRFHQRCNRMGESAGNGITRPDADVSDKGFTPTRQRYIASLSK